MTDPIKHVRKTDIEYRSEAATYNEKECAICWDPFQRGEIITLLACKHIFHRGCITSLDKCPLDQSEISAPEEYPIPQEMDALAFIQQLSSLDINQAAADYNYHVKRNTRNLARLYRATDQTTAYTYWGFEPPEEMAGHPRFPAILKRANEMFLGQKISAYNLANCLIKPFFAYNATLDEEDGARLLELYKNSEYSSPKLNQLRRDYERVSKVIKGTIAVSSAAFLWYFRSSLYCR